MYISSGAVNFLLMSGYYVSNIFVLYWTGHQNTEKDTGSFHLQECSAAQSFVFKVQWFQSLNVTSGSLKRNRLKSLSVIIGISDLIKN